MKAKRVKNINEKRVIESQSTYSSLSAGGKPPGG
jgi:hypothetical protein